MMTKHIIISSLLLVLGPTSSAAEALYTLLSPNEEQSGSFGFSVSGAGDVDGDGYAEVAVGAYCEAPGSSPYDAGRAYVFSGQTGSLLHRLTSAHETPGSRFGSSVAGAGDVNGDGYEDVVVGAYHETYNGSEWAGRAYVFSGQTGDPLHTLVSPYGSTHGYFGRSVAGAGDVNGDGRPDVVVGAWGESYGLGRAYVFNGQTGSVFDTLTSPNEADDNYFGYSVSGAGDVNWDGRPDIVVGAPGEYPGSSPQLAGRAYVFEGQTGTLLHTLISPNEEYWGQFGRSVAGAGDVNGDGYPDMVVGAPYEDPGASPYDAGRAYVFSGQTGALIHTLTSPNERPGGWFGYTVSGAGDVNGDGYEDVVVGANRENPGDSPRWAGRAYVFSGQTGTLLHTLISPNEEQGGYFGHSVAAAGDVNGDGRPDIVIGAHNEASGGSPAWAGRTHVFSWMDLSSDLTRDDLVLEWSTWSPASEYWIYAMTNEPWFLPDLSPPTYVSRVAVVPSGTTTWSSPNGIGDPEDNRTYLVIAIDDTNQELARSNRAGEHDFQGDIP